MKDTIWLLLDHGSVALPNESDRKNRSVEWQLRTNVNDGRILVASTIRHTSGSTSYVYHQAGVFGPDADVSAVCAKLGDNYRWCSEAEAEVPAKVIVNHFPPHQL